ncbi:MAG: DUF3192 domain-containing protein [Deltaproteobacteria bacterium]|nr:DUF3192 domain-containing protein [Deltaproteobacteria bacterium]MBW1952265.1 DUF3192 domain-containing protein [Deltaproteobacteria bacterium]MBW1987069.1 DUF3192 domain-containing protein [Deltaproteobacteria bacterium]MBW2133972.1 DUF3192 domain-containing protein [Deltaproteobacteria bacterium]
MPRWPLLLVLLCLLPACESILYPRVERQMWSNYVRLQDLKRGMNIDEVVGIMGKPKVVEKATYRGGEFTFYFYQTHSMDYEGSETVRGGYTPLVFQDDRLMGIGKRAYLQAVERPAPDGVPIFPWQKTQ